ncbi:MAG TPA: RelA/SpoT family protein [Marinilabiliaceae bacterium]|nr:RelA/SpoT family protein [Marinilabiliaceae bacterium]HBX88577.1 RelA/SpoT family protein [Marinilabiliaceae bacterium]
MENSLDNIPLSDRREILSAYRNLLRVSTDILQWDDIKLIREAIELSMQKTGFERHPSGKLLIVHSLEVARVTVEEVGLGKTSLICALLYELIRSSGTTKEEVARMFGSQEATIMEGLVKVYDLYKTNASIKSENFRKLLLMFAGDMRVVLIIIADRLCTMRSLSNYSIEEQLSISSEVSYLYAPMAHRLGLYSIKSEMEDLVMKYSDRETYKFIAKKLNETKRARDKYIKEFIEPLKQELKRNGLKFDIKGRTKTIHSIHNKMKKQNVEFEQVYDLFAIRVIVESEQRNEKADCWKVYSIVADKYQPNPRRMRDWLSVPKSNGYESLHTTVLGPDNKWVEVQIRSKRMDEVAERGLAAHWKYKGIKGDGGLDTWLENVREVLENPELNAVDLIDDFKLNLYDEEVFVFTPKGDLIRLPKGATVLDFAFDIHTEVGKKCVGAQVNGKNVPIKHQLNNGDHVSVNTSSSQVPKQDWLSIVATSRAKTKLKQALREMQYKESEIGRETLVRRLKNWKLELTDQLISQLVKHFRYKSVHDLFRDIALEKLDVVAVKEFIQSQESKEQERETAESLHSIRSAGNFVTPQLEEAEISEGEVLLIDKNLTNVDYKLAKCCNPIFGDDVFGFVTVSGGIKIHRSNCLNAPELRNKYAYRIVKAQWTGEASGSYQAAIMVVGEDDIGIISNISSVISKDQKIKTRSISVDSNEGLFEGTISVFVNNNQALNGLIKKIKGIRGIKSVSRLDGYGG